MGGGTDLDEAFRWMCQRSGGGDFLVLRASGDDDYISYILGLQGRQEHSTCKLNSAATLILPNPQAASDPFVADTIAHAEAIFIAGGDQASYIRNWQGTPVQAGINSAIQRGVPIGGTSAGLAVLGEWAYSAMNDAPDEPNLDSKHALADPLIAQIALVRGFLSIPILSGVITDSHFVKRNRIGRLTAMLARILNDWKQPGVHGLGIDERTAVLVDSEGRGRVVGLGAAYFLSANSSSEALLPGAALKMHGITVVKAAPGGCFDLKAWKIAAPASRSVSYQLDAAEGKLTSSQRGGAVY
jgi:cyanophycinase